MSDKAALTRYSGCDVLAKRDTPSWDAFTREAMNTCMFNLTTHSRHGDVPCMP